MHSMYDYYVWEILRSKFVKSSLKVSPRDSFLTISVIGKHSFRVSSFDYCIADQRFLERGSVFLEIKPVISYSTSWLKWFKANLVFDFKTHFKYLFSLLKSQFKSFTSELSG